MDNFFKSAFFIATAGGIFLLGLLIGKVVASPIQVSGDMSGWAQFFGGILAIAAAFIFGERSSRAALRNAQTLHAMEIKRKREAIMAILVAARAATYRIEEHYPLTRNGKVKLTTVFNRDAYLGFINAVSAISVLDLGSVEAVNSITGLKKAMNEIHAKAVEFLERPIPPHAVIYPEHGTHSDYDLWINPQIVYARSHHNALMHALENM